MEHDFFMLAKAMTPDEKQKLSAAAHAALASMEAKITSAREEHARLLERLRTNPTGRFAGVDPSATEGDKKPQEAKTEVTSLPKCCPGSHGAAYAVDAGVNLDDCTDGAGRPLDDYCKENV